MERAGRLRAWLSSPAALRRVSGYLTLGWVAMIPVSYFLHWLSSVTCVAALSLWALVSGHWCPGTGRPGRGRGRKCGRSGLRAHRPVRTQDGTPGKIL